VTVSEFLAQFPFIVLYPKIFCQVTDHVDHTLIITFAQIYNI